MIVVYRCNVAELDIIFPPQQQITQQFAATNKAMTPAHACIQNYFVDNLLLIQLFLCFVTNTGLKSNFAKHINLSQAV